MPKIQETKNGLFIYLPKQFTQLLNWGKGDILTIYPDNQNKQTLIIKKVIDAKETKEKTNEVKIIF